jgi:tetratricopeptide (TPR) repeat protein
MKLLYWGGGAGFKDENLEMLVAAVSKQPMRPGPRADTKDVTLVLGDLAYDARLLGVSDAAFLSFAEQCFTSLHHSVAGTTKVPRAGLTYWLGQRLKTLFRGRPKSGLRAWLDSHQREHEEIEYHFKHYDEVVQKLDKKSREFYQAIKTRLERRLPEHVQYFIHPGMHDFKTVLDVFGKERVLHNRAAVIDDKIVLGVGAMHDHDGVPYDLQLRTRTPNRRPTEEEEFLLNNSNADVLLLPHAIEGHYDPCQKQNKPGRANNFAMSMEAFVKEKWAKDGHKRSLHKLVITPAEHTGTNTQSNGVLGSVVLNTGRNVNVKRHYAYLVELDQQGVKQVHYLGHDERAGTVYRPTGQTFAHGGSYATTVHQILRYPLPEKKDVTLDSYPGGACERAEKDAKTTRRLRRTTTKTMLESLVEENPGAMPAVRNLLGQSRRAARERREHREETYALMRKLRGRVPRAKYEAVIEQRDEAKTEAREWKNKYFDLSNSYASWAYERVERRHYTAGREMYREALRYAPESNIEMVGAIMHNIGLTFERQRKYLDAASWYALANDFLPKNKDVKKSYARVVGKFMKP